MCKKTNHIAFENEKLNAQKRKTALVFNLWSKAWALDGENTESFAQFVSRSGMYSGGGVLICFD